MIYALWHGGTNYRRSSIHDNDLEVFESVERAKDALSDRARLGHHFPQSFTYADGRTSQALTPCADEGASMDVFLADPRETTDPTLDHRFVLTDDNDVVERES